MSAKLLKLKEMIGRPVTYKKENMTATRNGWTGLLIDVSTSDNSITVHWNELNGAQSYQAEAIVLPDSELQSSIHIPYIFFLEDADIGSVYLILAGTSGSIHRVFGQSSAIAKAQKFAQESEKGEAFTVFAATDRYEREVPPPPPIKHTAIQS